MDTDSYVSRGKEMLEYIANYLETIRERNVFPSVEPGYMRKLIPSEAPEEGEEWQKIMGDVDRVIMPGEAMNAALYRSVRCWEQQSFFVVPSDFQGSGRSFEIEMTHWQSPHMHAYFPANVSYPSMLGDMLSDGINPLGFTWASSPACTELEIIVMDWLAHLIGLPSKFLHSNHSTTGGGVLQTTCSEATMISLFAARTEMIQKLKRKPELSTLDDSVVNSKLVAYCSEQAHSSVEKAALIGLVKLKHLPTDKNYSLRGDTLLKAIKADKQQGLVPFFLCATLGTTGCCSFDAIEELGPICEKKDMWMHIDAAYAGSAFVCPEFQRFANGIEFAQSVVFNPSKWLLCNFDCTAMWVHSSKALHKTFNVDPLYLQHENSDRAIDFMHWQMGLSRRFRSLKLWFVMRAYGKSGLQSHIRQSVGNAAYFEKLVRIDPRFEIPAERHLGLVVLRLKGDNHLTERLLKLINKEGKIHMVPASLNGIYVIRFTITSPRTTQSDLNRDWNIIQRWATQVLDDAKRPAMMLRGKSDKRELRRRSTWSHYNQDWDVSLTLSNVSDHPIIVNGSFAALCDWSELTNALSLAKTDCANGRNVDVPESGFQPRRGLSFDEGTRLHRVRNRKLPQFEALSSESDSSPTENSNPAEDEVFMEKQERNGHYGVEG